MDQKNNSQEYQRGRHRLFFIGLGWDIILLSVIFFSGLSFALRDQAGQISSNGLITNGIYLLFFYLIFFVCHLPLDYYGDYIWEHKFNLSVQDRKQWFVDALKKTALSFVLLLILVEIIYVLLGRFPQHWWLGAGLVWLVLTFVLAKLTPAVIIPIFYKYSPIENEALRQSIMNLFESCRVPLKDVYAIDFSKKTKKANAFVCGLGQSRRVVLGDTLVENFSVEEINCVVAHELGHYKHGDILKLLWVNTATILLGFFLVNQLLRHLLASFGMARIDDIAFFPVILLAFILFGLITTPALNAYSRKIETEADQFCLETTSHPQAFISMMTKLGEMNLAEFYPSPFIEIFFYDHPPVGKRVAFAEKFTKKPMIDV